MKSTSHILAFHDNKTSPSSCVISIFGRKSRTLIDSGAQLSIISFDLFSTFSSLVKLDTNISEILLHSVDGSTIEIVGKSYLTFKIGSQIITHQFIVCKNITQPIILGRDFLSMHKVVLRFDNCSIELHGESIQLDNHKYLTSLVKVARDVVLPPRSTVTCYVKARQQRNKIKKQYLVSRISAGILKDQPGVFPVEGVVHIKSTKRFPIKIVNGTSTFVKINKGSMIAKLDEVKLVSSVNASLLQEINESIDPTHCMKHDTHTTPLEFQDDVDKLIKEFEDVFESKSGKLPATDIMEMKIELSDKTPIYIPPYKIPLHRKQQVDDAIKELLEADIIRPSSSPFNAPIVHIIKPDNSVRITQDFRKLNARIKNIAQPLPTIDDLLSCLHGAKFFTKLDMRKAFHCLKIREQDREFTAFSVNHKHFEFNRCAMGIKSSPGYFTQLMNKVLEGIHGVYVVSYMDDLLVYSKTAQEHLQHIKLVLQRIRQANLRLNSSKCEFFKTTVSYLGHVISDSGTSPSPEKVEIMKNLEAPKSVRGVRQFVGIFSFYRRYIPHFSEIADPIIQLTKKGVKFVWDEKCQTAFDTLKNALTNPPILAYPDINKKFILQTDASNRAIGAVLLQVHEHIEKPIFYLSHRLNETMRKLPSIELEAYSIIYALQKLDYFLADTYHKFEIRTDCRSLLHFFTCKHKNKKLQMWSIILSSYNCELVHVPGSKNVLPDFLSRYAQNTGDNDSSPTHTLDTHKTRQGKKKASTPTITNTHRLPPHNPKQQSNVCVINSDKLQLHTSDHKQRDPAFTQFSELEDVDIMNPPTLDIPHDFNIQTAQQDDEKLAKLIKQLNENTASTHTTKKFVILEGILYYLSEKDTLSPLRLVIPKRLQSTVLSQLHNAQGHLGIQKTYHLINERYYWSGLLADVTKHVSDCVTCTTRALNKNHVPMQHSQIPQYPFEMIAIDMSGPFVQTNAGNRYILSIMDLFSSWVECFAIPSKSTETVAHILLTEIIPRYSTFRVMVSDNGNEFVSQVIRHLNNYMGVTHIKTSIHRPEANGQIERFHRIMHDLIAKQLFQSRDETNWDLYLPFVLGAMRTSKNATTQHSSHFLLYKSDPVMPLDTILQSRERYYGDQPHKLSLERMHVAYRVTRRNIEQAQNKRIEKANEGSTLIQFKVGDPVFLLNKERTNKHSSRFIPYFRIVKQTGPVSFIIRCQLSGKLKHVHMQHLKLANLTKWHIPPRDKRIRKTRLAYHATTQEETDDADIESNDELHPPPLAFNKPVSDSEDDLPLIHFLNPEEQTSKTQYIHTNSPDTQDENTRTKKPKRKVDDFSSSDLLPLSHLHKRARIPPPSPSNTQNTHPSLLQHREVKNDSFTTSSSYYSDARDTQANDIMAIKKLSLLKEILASL